jgi:bacterioferritin
MRITFEKLTAFPASTLLRRNFMAIQPESRKNGRGATAAGAKDAASAKEGLSRGKLIDLLNDDLRREYQAVISYVTYSQTIKGAAYMAIAKELEKHAGEELAHAMTIAKQIDYLGGDPATEPMPVKISSDTKEMLQFDLDNENETIRNYRERVRQCEVLGEFALAEHIRKILVDEQEHQSDLADALGKDVPDVTTKAERA